MTTDVLPLLERYGLGDAHCHPQCDPDCLSHVDGVRARYLAVMGTRHEDWARVEEMHRRYPRKVIPCFGVHPWFAHLHAVTPEQASAPLSLLELSPKDDPAAHPWLAHLAPAPPDQWLPRLRTLLAAHPAAVVGEFGLDRAAVVPGSRAQPAWGHQLALAEAHLRLAAELRRPVSMHCVRGYGHLQDMLRRLGPEGCPPKIMLHSYGGSVDMVGGFTKLPGGLGSRIYFSFSTTINAAKGNEAAAAKLAARLAAVPEGRWLLESDIDTAAQVDGALCGVLRAAAAARGCSPERAAEAAAANFRDFYATSLAAMEAQPASSQQ